MADDLTLDEIRTRLAPLVADAAVFDGWSMAAVESAADIAGINPDVARLAFPDGPADMVSAWIASIDEAMVQAFDPAVLAAMPIRLRIRSLVWFRLEAVSGKEEALRRAMSIMAMPQNAKASLATAWHSADLMWRLAGDTATDYNHYSKRTILGSIYAASLVAFMDDKSEDKADTSAFLDRRIEGVMRFEKAKAQWIGKDRQGFSVTRFLGRLRYPAR